MDHESQKLFDTLVALEPHELRDVDIAFLKSRDSYLTTEQRERFADVLSFKKPAKKKAE
jgi:hypothetical protein